MEAHMTHASQVTGDRHGITYDKKRDRKRLNKQAQKVFDLMRDGKWRTLRQIADTTNYPEASISARLRDFRKQEFGAFPVERNRVNGGLWQYKLIVKPEQLVLI